MGNKILKTALCLLIIAVVFAGLGCAGRNADKNDRESTATPTPTPAPAATGHPAATLTPATTVQPGNYSTNLSPDDVVVSDGDLQDTCPEDSLPTPPAE
jgi:hypothetical protein